MAEPTNSSTSSDCLNRSAIHQPSHNPFATRWIRPGALSFIFPVGQSLSQLVERLVSNGWQGQIVGPHGSGKSTLLAVMIPACRDAGRDVRRYHLQSGQRRLPITPTDLAAWDETTLIVVDGYEQLSWLERWRLRRRCRQARSGLLITTHRPAHLPTLAATATNEPLLRELVAQLLARDPSGRRVPDARITTAFQQHRGNLREALLELFDAYEVEA